MLFKGKLDRLVEPRLWTGADLAALRPVAAKGVCLRLVAQQARKDDPAPPPEPVGPLQDLDVCSQSVPALQQLGVALMKQAGLARGAPVSLNT